MVSHDDKARLIKLLRRHKDCFAYDLSDLGCINITEMKIELNSQRSVVYRPYRLSYHEREKVLLCQPYNSRAKKKMAVFACAWITGYITRLL